MIERLCIIGVGLIGGSLALALREAGYVKHITGCGRSQANLDVALKLNIIDSATTDPAKAVEGADVVLLAVPVGHVGELCKTIRPHLEKNAVLTDVGSVKTDVVQQVEEAFGEIPENFVPGHPIAGTERSGAEAAFADLYRNRKVLLTPLTQTSTSAVKQIQEMWEAAGAEVEQMSVRHHDEILAASSHLPHMLAFGLVDSLARQKDYEEIFRYAAGGFRDFTRIASSDPVMWRDICIHNRSAILKAMDQYQTDLDVLRQAIDSGDEKALLEIFTRAKTARDKYAQ